MRMVSVLRKKQIDSGAQSPLKILKLTEMGTAKKTTFGIGKTRLPDTIPSSTI